MNSHLFSGICDTPFLDINKTWNTETPQLTPCMIDTACTWAPAALLWLFFPYQLYDYITSKRISIRPNWSNRIKLLLSMCVTVISLVQLVLIILNHSSSSSSSSSNAELIAGIVNFLTSGLLIICIHFQRIFGFVNGGLVWFFLFFKLIMSLLSLPTVLYDDDYQSPGRRWVWLCKFGAEILLLLSCSFADKVDNIQELLSSSSLYGRAGSNYLLKNDNEEENEGHEQNAGSTDDLSFKGKQSKRICPKEIASFPSKLTFWWFNSLVFKGARKTLTSDDMWAVRQPDRSTNVFQNFNEHWKHSSFTDQQQPKEESNGVNNNFVLKSANDSKINVLVIIWRAYHRLFVFPSAARFITDHLQLANPIIMKYLIGFANDDTAPFWQGIFFALFFVATNVAGTFVNSYHQHRMSVLGMRIRNSLLGSIYRKSLVLAPHSRKNFTSGEIVNMMAVDSQRFIELLPWICFLWTAPFQIAIALWLLWGELGASVLGGLGLMILFIPINLVVAKKVKEIQNQQMKQKDSRLKMINELLNGMKVLKLYAWEPAFVKNIQNIRINELNLIQKSGYIATIFNMISACSPFMVACITFTIFVFSDPNNSLTAEKAFVSIALFNLLRIPLTMIPNMISNLILVLVSTKRMNRFLNADEVTPYVNRTYHPDKAIIVNNGTFSWDSIEEDNEPNVENFTKKEYIPRAVLSNISVEITKGTLVAIVGSVGSGKSSLIHSLLGEMQKLSGSVQISNDQRIAYVAQQAWIQNATVRGNILFGAEYQGLRYRKVIEACALKPDLKMLTDGDQTEIGEKGINLSGGQKQRISIARACYSNSDLYLFDDPLSAVDSHVGKHIFENVLSTDTGILKSKTRILVTNALYMLPRVDKIVLLKNGTVEAVGSYEELIANCMTFSELIANYTSSNIDDEKDSSNDSVDELVEMEEDQGLSESQVMITRTTSITSFQSVRERTQTALSTSSKTDKAKPTKLIEAESMAVGQVTLSVYKKFFSSISVAWSLCIVGSYFLIAATNLASNMWIGVWTEDNDKPDFKGVNFYLAIYAAIGISQAFFVCSGWISIVKGTMRASRNLHWKLLNSIVRAPMHFFDVTPLGRIVNRFSKDIDVLDTYMQFLLRVLFNTTFQVLATLFIISYKQAIFLVVAVPFVILYFFIQRFYVQTSRQLKRLESVSRSPIFTHFSETISGVSTIKAYQVAKRFIRDSDSRIDENQRCLYPSQVANCWLQVRLEFMANCLVFFAAIFAALSKNWSNKLSGADTGLSLSYALNVTLALNFCVRMFADLENNVVSVERISEYTEVEAEGDWKTEEDKKLSPKWPEEGAIEFDAYATRYRPGLDLVLRRVDLEVEKGVKIGIVGRTGAGKSSLTLALFRIIEAASGKIKIDGIDISKLGLQTLRANITIIPQDPVLFAGTIRTNLDPFNNYNDHELWSALEHSHLKAFVQNLDTGLEYSVSEAGENLSVGQRQLICLARALLRKKKILVLDEATSGVDLETDSLIQNTIKQEFHDCTILTIAHRLHTIMDSDRVLVLDAGQVAEYDSPKALLANDQSIFYSLAKDAGIVS